MGVKYGGARDVYSDKDMRHESTLKINIQT